MSGITFGRVAEDALTVTEAQRIWRIASIALLSTRVIQGFIYWGGGSRRFIYGPSKLDAWGGHSWMANKFQTAMPGALLGTDYVIAFMLHHFWVLYPAVVLFSAAELIAGAALMAGLMTRVAAAVSIGFSFFLMLMFGWQGATCIDEWTMAACNMAMGATLLLAGGGAYSLDNVLLRRNPALAERRWFHWASGSLPLPMNDMGFRNLGLIVLAGVLVFDISTYSYYRGSVITPFHGGPVSPTQHHFTLTKVTVLPDGSVRFHIYLDGGTPEAPAHIMKAVLLAPAGQTLATWNTETLTKLPATDIHNDFAYNKFKGGPYGLVATMGAMATITLPPAADAKQISANAALKLTDVNGRTFTGAVEGSP